MPRAATLSSTLQGKAAAGLEPISLILKRRPKKATFFLNPVRGFDVYSLGNLKDVADVRSGTQVDIYRSSFVPLRTAVMLWWLGQSL